MKLAEIARQLNCELRGDGDIDIQRVASLEDAGPGDLTFVANPKYMAKLRSTRASAVIAAMDARDLPLPSLRTKNPYWAFAQALQLFYCPRSPLPGIHPSAVISLRTRIGSHPFIGPYAVLGEDVVIGDNARIFSHVTIYPRVRVGDNFVAHAGVVIREDVIIGHNVTIHSGAVIGGDGFGYVLLEDGKARKIAPAGTVIIEDEVEIGANTTVDRATVGATVIRRGTKIDNLVMIAHGCEVGENCLLAAQVGLAGSTRLDEGVRMGGQAGAAGHLTVGRHVQVAGQSGITNSVPPHSVIAGCPAIDAAVWRKAMACVPHLPDMARRLRKLEKAVAGRTSAQRESGEDT